MSSRQARLLTLAIVIGVGQVASAQIVWNQLLTENAIIPGADSLPDFSPLDTVRNNGFRDLRITPNGNFSVITNTDPSQGFSSFSGTYYVAGSDDRGETIRALRREDTIGGLTQRTISGSGAAIDHSGSLFYTSRLAEPDNRTVAWVDDTLLFTPGQAITDGPLNGSFLSGVGWASTTPDGVRSWVSGYATTGGGGTVGEALFRDENDFDVLLQTGDNLGAGLVAGTNAISGNLAWSALGTNYLTKSMVSSNNFTDDAVVLNGQVVGTVGGGVLREGDPIPAPAGGLPSETWAPGSLVAVNEAGDWAVSAAARINGVGNTTRDMIVLNGEIVFADGDVVDGHTLSGLPSHLSLNDRGDLAFAWDNKAFLNGEIIAEVGGPVDTDGDGIGDKTITNLFDVDLTNLPSANDDGTPLIYLKARVTGGLEVVLRNDRPTLEGDYNGDGLVNAADYTVWRDTNGSQLLLGADGDQDNQINAADLTFWSDNYGGFVSGSSVSVPEPATILCICAVFASLAVRRTRAAAEHT